MRIQKQDIIIKTCECGNTFSVIKARRIGRERVRTKGWHLRKHCYKCLPQCKPHTKEYVQSRWKLWYSKPENKERVKELRRLRRNK